jgi:hypothetical protein
MIILTSLLVDRKLVFGEQEFPKGRINQTGKAGNRRLNHRFYNYPVPQNLETILGMPRRTSHSLEFP